MSRCKLVYPGNLIRTTLASKTHRPVDERCRLCQRLTFGPFWFHLDTKLVVCDSCMPDAWDEQIAVALSLHDKPPVLGWPHCL